GNLYIKKTKLLFNGFGNIICTAIFITLGNNYNAGSFFIAGPTLQLADQVVYSHFFFRKQDSFCASCSSCMKGNTARVAAHYLNKEKPVMGSCCIPYFVYRFNYSICCRIVT